MALSSLFATELLVVSLCVVVVCSRASGEKRVRFAEGSALESYTKAESRPVYGPVKSTAKPGTVSNCNPVLFSDEIKNEVKLWLSSFTPPVVWDSVSVDEQTKILTYCEKKTSRDQWDNLEIHQWIRSANIQASFQDFLGRTGFEWIKWEWLSPDEQEEILEFARLIDPKKWDHNVLTHFRHIIAKQVAHRIEKEFGKEFKWDTISVEIQDLILGKAMYVSPTQWHSDCFEQVHRWLWKSDVVKDMLAFKDTFAPAFSEMKARDWFRGLKWNANEESKCCKWFEDEVRESIKEWMRGERGHCGWENICETGLKQMTEWGLKKNHPENWSKTELEMFWKWICPLDERRILFLSEFAPHFPTDLLPETNPGFTTIFTPEKWNEYEFRQWVQDTVVEYIKRWLEQLEPQGDWDSIPEEVQKNMIETGMNKAFPDRDISNDEKKVDDIDNVAIKLWLSNLPEPLQWSCLPKSSQAFLVKEAESKCIRDWEEHDERRIVMELHDARIDGIKIWLSQWDPTPDWNTIPHDVKTVMMNIARVDPPQNWSEQELQMIWPLIFPGKKGEVVKVLIKRWLLKCDSPVMWKDINFFDKQKMIIYGRKTSPDKWGEFELEKFNKYIFPISTKDKIKKWIAQWEPTFKNDDIEAQGFQRFAPSVPVENWDLHPTVDSRHSVNTVLVNRWLASWNRPIRWSDIPVFGQSQMMEYWKTLCPSEWGFEELITFKEWIYPETPTDKIQNWLFKNAPYVDMSKIAAGVLEQVIDTMMNNPDKNWSEKLDKGIHDSAAIRFWLSQLTPAVKWGKVSKEGQNALMEWGLKRSPFMWSEQEKDQFFKWIYPDQVPKKTKDVIAEWLLSLRTPVDWKSISKPGQQEMIKYGVKMYPHKWDDNDRIKFLKWIYPDKHKRLVGLLMERLSEWKHSHLRSESRLPIYFDPDQPLVWDQFPESLQFTLLKYSDKNRGGVSRIPDVVKVIDLGLTPPSTTLPPSNSPSRG